MPATEIIAIVSGLVGCLTAVVASTPCIRLPLEECYSYLKHHEEKLLEVDELRSRLEVLIQTKQRTKLEAGTVETCMQAVKNARMAFFEATQTPVQNTDYGNVQTTSEAAEDKWMKDAWMKDAEETLDKIINFQNVESSSCLISWCSCWTDYQRRYQIGKHISVIKQRVNKLANELKGDRGSKTVDVPMRICSSYVCPERIKVIKEITQNVLTNYNQQNQGTLLFGVYGASGVGKTDAVTRVYNKILLENRSRFDTFIWVEASAGDDLKKLQMKIASKIGLILSNDDGVRDNAIKLENALLGKGKILLILDNMRKAFSLEEIGFPTVTTFNCIIMTSRSSSVCVQMKCQRKFILMPLSPTVAYGFLINEIGLQVVYLPANLDIRQNLWDIGKECCGLPLAIVSVAKHLRKLNWYDSASQKRALKKELAAFSNFKYIEDKVFEDLMNSYEKLKHSSYSSAQQCLLFCTLYPRDMHHQATFLTKHWVAEGLLGEVECLDEKLGQAEEILEELKDASLMVSIDDENGEEIVMIHPLVWDMAVKMEKGNPRFFVKRNHQLDRFACEDLPRDVERVSLMMNNLNEIRTGPTFCMLSTLLLQRNPLKVPLHNDFFKNVPNLKILNLAYTGVRVLPESVSYSKNLTILVLRECDGLTCLPSLAELVELMVLDVSGCPIAELPDGMKHLTKLVQLYLSRTRIRSFPRHLLAALKNLQEFSMIGCDLLWLRRSLMQDATEASIDDLQELQELVLLEINLANTQMFLDHITIEIWRRLKSYKFCVGGLYNGQLRNNSLAFIKEIPNGPNCLPDNMSELLIMRCPGVTELTLPYNLQNLKYLDVSYCFSLRYLFTFSVCKFLFNLEEIVIADCPNLVTVIEPDVNSDGNVIVWNRLRKITLFNLPKLQRTYFAGMQSNSILETIGIWNCSELVSFPISLVVDNYGRLQGPPSFNMLIGDRSWLESLQRHHQNTYILESSFIELPPPPTLTSRVNMTVPPNSVPYNSAPSTSAPMDSAPSIPVPMASTSSTPVPLDSAPSTPVPLNPAPLDLASSTSANMNSAPSTLAPLNLAPLDAASVS